MTRANQISQALISGIQVPDSKLANEITEFIRDTESTLLFNHSNRVYYFGALAGQRRGLEFDAELLYAGAMFHDIGLVPAYSSDADRFEVDGANAACDFLRRHNISEQDIDRPRGNGKWTCHPYCCSLITSDASESGTLVPKNLLRRRPLAATTRPMSAGAVLKNTGAEDVVASRSTRSHKWFINNA
jgi:hypothetical protein